MYEIQLTKVVNHDEEACTKHGTEPGTSPYIAVQEDARRYSGVLLLAVLDVNETDDEEAEDDEEGDNAATSPSVLGASPLQRKQQAYDGRQEESGALEIELNKLLLPGGLDLLSTTLDAQERDDECSCNCTKRQINIETPTPCEVVSEGTSHERTGNRSNAVHATDQSHVRGALAQRDSASNDEDGTAEDTRGTNTSHSATNDECSGVGRNTADQRAYLKNAKRCEVHPLNRVESVELSVDELGCAGSK